MTQHLVKHAIFRVIDSNHFFKTAMLKQFRLLPLPKCVENGVHLIVSERVLLFNPLYDIDFLLRSRCLMWDFPKSVHSQDVFTFASKWTLSKISVVIIVGLAYGTSALVQTNDKIKETKQE